MELDILDCRSSNLRKFITSNDSICVTFPNHQTCTIRTSSHLLPFSRIWPAAKFNAYVPVKLGTLVRPRASFHADATSSVSEILQRSKFATHAESGHLPTIVETQRQGKGGGEAEHGRVSRERDEHTGSLSFLALGCRCGSGASRSRCLIGLAFILQSVTHELGDCVDVCSISLSARIPLTSIIWCKQPQEK